VHPYLTHPDNFDAMTALGWPADATFQPGELAVHNTTTHPVKEVEAPARILMSVVASEQTVQMVEREDGTLMILIDGVNPMHLRWPARQVEACTRTYMRLIKRC